MNDSQQSRQFALCLIDEKKRRSDYHVSPNSNKIDK
jgi:hypothetical protein